ncbi:hypothetical protein ABZU32_00905 [Sphaerisporangium sp. NPDC005288]|uniref:PE domain-containing protein n=1 Tax=Sphaerisporangium rhizosphaerae TaxID=2269375 RepID=A0ABW2NX48_9ACTN
MAGNDGYQDFHLDGDWPGTDAKGKTDVHHTNVENLLRDLLTDVEQLKGVKSGSLSHLRAFGKVSPTHLGEWDAAQQLGTVLGQGHTAVTASYEKLIAQYEAAIETIRTAYGNLKNAETASTVDQVKLV